MLAVMHCFPGLGRDREADVPDALARRSGAHLALLRGAGRLGAGGLDRRLRVRGRRRRGARGDAEQRGGSRRASVQFGGAAVLQLQCWLFNFGCTCVSTSVFGIFTCIELGYPLSVPVQVFRGQSGAEREEPMQRDSAMGSAAGSQQGSRRGGSAAGCARGRVRSTNRDSRERERNRTRNRTEPSK